MDPLTASIVWCIVQITLVGLLAWLLCTAVSRWTGPGAAMVPAVALAAVVVLTACAFVPWPKWWRYGPQWQVPTTATSAVRPAAGESNAPRTNRGETSVEVTSTPLLASDAVQPFDVFPSLEAAPQTPTTAQSQHAADFTTQLADLGWGWLPHLLASVFVGGVVLGLLQLAGGLLSVRACRRASQPLADVELSELVDCLRAELCLTRGVELRESDHLATAATVGWTRPVILLPRGWREWTEDQRRAVLAHELAHVARGDYLACVLAQLSLAIHFYHPLVHWLAARLRLEQELAADATAAMLSGGRKSYLQSLAELALHTSERSLGWPAHTFLPTQGTFLRRIEMLRDSKLAPAARPRPNRAPRWAAVGLLIVGAAVIAGLRGGAAVTPFDATANAQQQATEAGGTKTTAGMDLAHVTSDAKMLLAIRPAEVAKVPEIREALEDADRQRAPLVKLLTLDGVEQITLIGLAGVEPNDWGKDALAVLQFNKATTYDDVAKTGVWPADALRLPGRPAAGQPGATQSAYGVIDDRTLVLGSVELVGRYLANRRKGQPAIAAGAAWDKVRMGAIVAAIDMEVVREQFRKLPENTDRAGPDALLATLSPLWTDSEYVLSGIIVEGKTVHLRAIATCHNAELAEHVADTVSAAATLARNTMRSARENERDIPAFARFAMETADGLLKSVKVQRSESIVVAQTSTELPKASAAAAGSLIGAISQVRTSAQRMQSANNLKQIGLALHNYAAANGGRFPPPVLMGQDGKGKVPHSWRVAILPYLVEEELHRQYQFDEPWDSDANKRVLAKMPPLFRNPADDPKSTSSSYFVLRSEKLLETTAAPGGGETAPEGGFPTAFSANSGMSFNQIHDGTSYTLSVVEAKRDIPWTKPEDILFDPAKDPPKLGGFFKDGFHVGLCDGSVRLLSEKTDPKILKLLIMPQDGTPLPPEF
jgi:beta-lactamase regulating signal transducer with metallopeptidase domain